MQHQKASGHHYADVVVVAVAWKRNDPSTTLEVVSHHWMRFDARAYLPWVLLVAAAAAAAVYLFVVFHWCFSVLGVSSSSSSSCERFDSYNV